MGPPTGRPMRWDRRHCRLDEHSHGCLISSGIWDAPWWGGTVWDRGPIRILIGLETAAGVVVVASDPHANDNHSHLEALPISRHNTET